jgi:DNA-binding NtrC family response regulator
MSNRAILVVDDQLAHRDLCRTALAQAGFAVETAASGAEAIERLHTGSFGLVITDQLMPGMSGMELLREIHRLQPHLPVIMVTAYGTVETAVDAMRAGASDFIQKPFTPDELLLVTQRVLEHQDLVEEVRTLRERVGDLYRFDRIVSKSPKMTEIFEMVRNLADLDTTVLITGETGTGKELVAQAIHHNSHRRDQRFVRINCGALTETLLESELFGHERGAFSGAVQARRGKFEYASGGTLLLDEIGDISPAMQLKLLRVLQEKEIQRVGGNETITVDVRILATTNKDLEEAMAAGVFRSDLYYRLNVARIHLPPLRERMEDVPLLTEHFLRSFCEKTGRPLRGMEREVMNAMMDYDWPGNVRELANVIERAAVMVPGDRITAVELPARPPRLRTGEPVCINTDLPLKEGRQRVIADYEKTYLVQCLRRYRGNISQSAQHCGVDAKTFYRKMQEYGLDKRDFKKIEDPVEPDSQHQLIP